MASKMQKCSKIMITAATIPYFDKLLHCLYYSTNHCQLWWNCCVFNPERMFKVITLKLLYYFAKLIWWTCCDFEFQQLCYIEKHSDEIQDCGRRQLGFRQIAVIAQLLINVHQFLFECLDREVGLEYVCDSRHDVIRLFNLIKWFMTYIPIWSMWITYDLCVCVRVCVLTCVHECVYLCIYLYTLQRYVLAISTC